MQWPSDPFTGDFYLLPSVTSFMFCTSIVLALFHIRADLAVGCDLAPLAYSAVDAIKSLASALAAKFGL